MSNNEIKDLLGKLRDEIGKTELDDDTLSLVRDLDADIDDLLDPEGDRAETDSVLEKARELETNFATEHPSIERFMREFMTYLSGWASRQNFSSAVAAHEESNVEPTVLSDYRATFDSGCHCASAATRLWHAHPG